jgi:hypothetical protein
MDDPPGGSPGSAINPMEALDHSHDPMGEVILGSMGGPWYLQDMPYYYHGFRTPLSVFVAKAGGLSGGMGLGLGRPDYWEMKSFVNIIRAINRLAGRTIIAIVPVDQL